MSIQDVKDRLEEMKNKDETGSLKRLAELMRLDNTPYTDVERLALFHIIASNDELWNSRNRIYNFDERCIEFDILESGICSSSMTLVKLGFNLFNNFKSDMTVLDTFSNLDEKNSNVAMMAIKIRLGMNK